LCALLTEDQGAKDNQEELVLAADGAAGIAVRARARGRAPHVRTPARGDKLASLLEADRRGAARECQLDNVTGALHYVTIEETNVSHVPQILSIPDIVALESAMLRERECEPARVVGGGGVWVACSVAIWLAGGSAMQSQG